MGSAAAFIDAQLPSTLIPEVSPMPRAFLACCLACAGLNPRDGAAGCSAGFRCAALSRGWRLTRRARGGLGARLSSDARAFGELFLRVLEIALQRLRELSGVAPRVADERP